MKKPKSTKYCSHQDRCLMLFLLEPKTAPAPVLKMSTNFMKSSLVVSCLLLRTIYILLSLYYKATKHDST